MKEKKDKIIKYSIRKLSLGVAPIVVGTLIFGSYIPSNVAQAGTISFKYIEEHELSDKEKSMIKLSIPKEYKDEQTYYMVYKKVNKKEGKVLPNTGQSSIPLYGLGIGLVTVVVLLISKKNRNKVLSVLLIGALGQSIVIPYEVFALESKIFQNYNVTKEINNAEQLQEGIINIPGYEYVGYLTDDDLKVLPVYEGDKKQRQLKKNNQSEKSDVLKDEKVVSKKGTQELGHEGEALVQEKPEYAKKIEVKGTQEENRKGQALTQSVQPTYTKALETKGTQEFGHEGEALVQDKLEYTKKIEVKGTQEEDQKGQALTQSAQQAYTKPLETKGTQEFGHEGESLVQEKPEYTKTIEVKGTREEGHEGGALAQEVLTEYTKPLETRGTQEIGHEGESLVQEKPEYTKTIEVKGTREEGREGVALVQEALPEYTKPLETKGTQEPEHGGKSLVQEDLPEYTKPLETKGTQEPDHEGEALVQEKPGYTKPLETKGTQESGHEGEALVQEDLPGYTKPLETKGTQESEHEGEALVQEDLPEYTKPLETKGTQEPGHEGESLVQEDVPEYTGDAKIEPVTEEELPALEVVTRNRTERQSIPFEIEEIIDPMLLKNRRRIEQQGQEGLRTIEYEDYLVNGNVEASKELSRNVVDPIKQIVKVGTLVKVKPTVEITSLTKDENKKSITVNYNLIDTTWSYVSAKAQIFHGDQLVKEVDIENPAKEQVITGLDYYTPYTIKTRLTYNLGENDEQSTEVSTKNFELDYKKIEIKDIDSVELYGKENGRYRRYLSLSEVPTDTTKYFAKVKSDRFKEMYLPVQSITENADGTYKVTAAVDQLVEEGAEGYKDNYTFNVAKTKAEQPGVYTSFKQLVTAMQGNMSGIFKLASDMTADEVGLEDNQTSYLSGEFTGTLVGEDGTKPYAIYDLRKPLFETLKNATVRDLDLKNVDIDSKENAAALAKVTNNANISNVSVEGKISGRKSVAGLVVSASDTRIENSSFTGSLVANHADSASGYTGGIVGNITGGNSTVDKVKVDAKISTSARNNNQVAGGIAGKVERGALISNSSATGKILNGNGYPRVGGIVGSTYYGGRIDNVVSSVDVGDGYAITGDQYNGANVKNAVTSVDNKKQDMFATKVTKEQADEKVDSYGITTTLDDTGENLKNNIRTTDYTTLSQAQRDRRIAYNNIEKLMPFYNKELVIHYGNKVATTDKLYSTELLDVVPMKDKEVVTDIDGNKNLINKIMLHYKDNTVEYLDVTFKENFTNSKVVEYNVSGKEYIFTPEAFVSDYTKISNNVLAELQGVTYNSDAMKQVLGVTDNAAIDNLYLDREFEKVKANLGEYLRKVLAMDKSINTDGDGVVEYVSEKIKNNKEAFLLGLTYMSRWYNINYDKMNVKDLSMYKFDFDGNNSASTLDAIIALGNSGLENLKGSNTVGLYGSTIAPLKGKDTIFDFVEAYRKLFLPEKTNNQWLKDNTKAYIVEVKSNITEVRAKQEAATSDSKYSLGIYDRLSSPKWRYKGMLLPLLTLPEENIYAISNISTLAFGSYERYKDRVNGTLLSGEALRQYVREKVNQSAEWQRDHYDIWYNLLTPESKDKLFRSVPVTDGFYFNNAEGRGYWATATDKNIEAIYNFFGPAGKWYSLRNGAGAFADGSEVYFVSDRLLDQYGTSVYTHEMTHNSDGDIYFEGYGRREGLGAELYAYGLLQSASRLDEEGVILNTAFKGEKDSLTRLHTYDPTTRYRSAADLKEYVHGMHDVLYTLDAMEANAILTKSNDVKKKWYRKLEDTYVKDTKYNKDTHATNTVRQLTDAEVEKLTTLDSLIDNDIISRRAYRDSGSYGRNGYYAVSMFSPIYSALSNPNGAPGDVTFKKVAYELLAEKGYQDGFIPYVSNKYGDEALRNGMKTYSSWFKKDVGLITDTMVLNKVFGNQYATWADFRKAMFNERIAKQNRLKPITIQYELGVVGSTKEVTILSAQEMQALINAAVERDITNIDRTTSHAPASWVHLLKQKIYNAYLRTTDDFRESIYK